MEKRFQALAAHQRFDEAVAIAVAELLRQERGSLLLFLRAWGNSAGAGAAGRTGGRRCGALSAVRALPLSEQRKAILLAAEGQRKVVLATTIAETSLTIEGIRLVVDSAERVARFDARTGLTRLITQRISRVNDPTRRSRRPSGAGICLHLIGKEQAERAAAQSDPEILHSDLSALLLELLQWGCRDPAQLHWLDLPPEANLAAARRLLTALSALESDRLSARGRQMASCNDPRLAAMLTAATDPDDAATAAKLAAILEEPPRGGNSDLGGVCPPAAELAARWAQQLLKRLGSRDGQPDAQRLAPLLAPAFVDRIARRRGQEGRYQLANGMGDAGRRRCAQAPRMADCASAPAGKRLAGRARILRRYRWMSMRAGAVPRVGAAFRYRRMG